MAAAPDGSSYWLAAQNGDVYSYSTAKDGSKSHTNAFSPVIGIGASTTGSGYWLASADGTVLRSGSSRSYAVVPAEAHSEPITAFSPVS